MATGNNGNSIWTTGKIQASDLNDIANHYRQWFAVNYSAPGGGARIYASDWNNLRQAILNGAGSAFTLNNFPGSFNTNSRIYSTTWGNATANFSPITIEYTGNGSYTIPNGCNSMTLNQLVGGGGGGGSALSYNNEGDQGKAQGGGGGSGGHIWNVTTSVTAGQVITIIIGGGGAGGASAYGVSIGHDGSSGGSSAILINGNTWQSVSGGGGGSFAVATVGKIVYGDGGVAGSPNGNAGNNQGTGGAAPYGSYGSGGAGALASNGVETRSGNNGANGYANITFNP